MKPVRWTQHALNNLAEREIDRAEAEMTLAEPELIMPGQPRRRIFMRRYFDAILQQEMLLRLVVEDTATELLVITIYKTSQMEKYLKRPGL